jgi:hypothetical protein
VIIESFVFDELVVLVCCASGGARQRIIDSLARA